jgi:DNA-binding HxlR family transcriptional regulator
MILHDASLTESEIAGCCGAEDAANDACGGDADASMTALFEGFKILQEKWVLFIVNSLRAGSLGFNEIQRRAAKVNTTTLSQRLSLLEHCGIVTRTELSAFPPKTSYSLTEKGRALSDVIEAIKRWSVQYYAGGEYPSEGHP